MKRLFRDAPLRTYIRIIPALLLLLILLPLHAHADNVVQGYKSKGVVQQGFLVSMVKNSQDTVEATPAGDSGSIYGVVIDPSNAPLTLNRQVEGQVFVATTGNYQVFVSTERGNIRQGDYVSISSTSGIAALVAGDQKSIIGQALEAFDGKKGVITKAGNFSVGKIMVNIDPRKNPVATNDVFVPGFMRTVGAAVAGKPVSAQRIYLSLVFLIAAVTLATTLLWASVRGGMIAMGRNPLNRGHILNSMFRVVSAAVLVFLVGLFGVYLLLRI
ncbi:MAG: rane protein of unknown function [Candidatus Saccharibacteria bacterium]|nr:rane protein of unknown function [Candidatus Saccharibacteria bacterium]